MSILEQSSSCAVESAARLRTDHKFVKQSETEIDQSHYWTWLIDLDPKSLSLKKKTPKSHLFNLVLLLLLLLIRPKMLSISITSQWLSNSNKVLYAIVQVTSSNYTLKKTYCSFLFFFSFFSALLSFSLKKVSLFFPHF